MGDIFVGSSPLTRGARRSNSDGDFTPGIIPAHAGSTVKLEKGAAEKEDHPRSRGEHSRFPHSQRRLLGSSPLTRGALGDGDESGTFTGIIPAHAGSTASQRRRRPSSRDQPRSRGEHPAARKRRPLDPRIIPAHAGSTGHEFVLGSHTVDHPRSRGEHPYRVARDRTSGGSSPLTRGAQPLKNGTVPRDGIIPAHAGSTARPVRG